MGGPRVREVPAEEVLRSPSGDCFVRASRAKGILPEILEELLAARKRAKADLKAASDPFVKAVLDGRQLALKARTPSCLSPAMQAGMQPCCHCLGGITQERCACMTARR
jgi:DNA polymerase delta subunit 1